MSIVQHIEGMRKKWISSHFKDGWRNFTKNEAGHSTTPNSFIRLNFLTEEVGEVSRVVRAIEIGRDRPDEQTKTQEELKQELKEELGDVLSNLIVLSQKYDLDLQDIMETHVTKLSKRFETSK